MKIVALDNHRPNLVARLKGSGKKRPLLVMGHTDVVNVGCVYGHGLRGVEGKRAKH